MALTIIDAQLTRQLLPIGECIEVMESAMIAATGGTLAVPPRLTTPLIDDSGMILLMPGSSRELGRYGAKVIGLHPNNPTIGLPSIQGFVILFDFSTGAPLALVEGASLTAIRTAAASGLATRLLAKADSTSCGILGTGIQAVSHLDAICAVRPIEKVVLWGRNFDKAEVLAAQQSKLRGLDVRATRDPQEAGHCDVICTVTGSAEPILLGEWVRPGAHVNLVGSHSLTTREADTSLIVKSAVYVDLLESTYNEGGDVMIPVREGKLDKDHICGEIGGVLTGDIPGRSNDSQITLYNSLGIFAQDLFAAQHVYQKALALGLGVSVDF